MKEKRLERKKLLSLGIISNNIIKSLEELKFPVRLDIIQKQRY